MGRNILIFADGTGQVGGMRPDQQMSNIYKLYRATRVWPDNAIDPREQVAFYDPGLGTMAPGDVRVSLWDRIKGIAGLAVGLGFSGNVIDCYEAILKRYEPGDRIYLFGFSRGGYTARAVANVLNLCGVPTTDGEGKPLPRAGKRLRAIAHEAVVRVYEHGAGHPRARYEAQREAIARRFRRKYGAGDHPSRGEVHPQFVGVFDAVAALGLPLYQRVLLCAVALGGLAFVAWLAGALASRWWDWSASWVGSIVLLAGVVAAVTGYITATLRWASKDVRGNGPLFHLALWRAKHYDRFLDPRIPVVRHALAIDETRKHFGRVKWGARDYADEEGAERPRFRQRWFAGNHSDIGGSYPEDESRLSDIALDWMVKEATKPPHPIKVDETKLRRYPDPLGMQHSEVFSQRQRPWWKRLPWPERPRYIDPAVDVDPSVLVRFEAECVANCDLQSSYRPEALRAHKDFARFYETLG